MIDHVSLLRRIRISISDFRKFGPKPWLSENPLIGKPRTDIKPGYYSFPEGRHVIFYTLTSYGIDVIGIPHQRMDVAGYLDEEA